MGMSTHVYGFCPPDEEWKKKRDAFVACEKAGVAVPKAIWDFFRDEEPDPAGVKIILGGAVSSYSEESQEGFEIDVSKLPPNVKIIRFVNSY